MPCTNERSILSSSPASGAGGRARSSRCRSRRSRRAPRPRSARAARGSRVAIGHGGGLGDLDAERVRSIPVLRTAPSTVLTHSGWVSSRAPRFTDSPRSLVSGRPCQSRAGGIPRPPPTRRSPRSTRSPPRRRGTRAGPSRPRSGCSQRSRASAPRMRPLVRSTCGWYRGSARRARAPAGAAARSRGPPPRARACPSRTLARARRPGPWRGTSRHRRPRSGARRSTRSPARPAPRRSGGQPQLRCADLDRLGERALQAVGRPIASRTPPSDSSRIVNSSPPKRAMVSLRPQRARSAGAR